MNQAQKAARFAKLHVKGDPVLLYNAWDAGSAAAIHRAGAKAIATGSWSVARAQGFSDGQDIPLEFLEQIVGRIAGAVDVPVSVDFEGGYSENDQQLARNISRLLKLGIVGINFEDRIVKGPGLYSIDRQARRIEVIRRAATKSGINLFINARTDVFFQAKDAAKAVGDALDRSKAYAAAGASSFFVPGLTDPKLIARICAGSGLPVNVMMMDGVPTVKQLARLGVARVSYGPIPYVRTIAALTRDAQKIY